MEKDVENSFGNTCNEVDSASFVDDAPQSTSSIAASVTDEVPSDDVSYIEELCANSLSEPLSENANNNTSYSDNLKEDTSQSFGFSTSWKNPGTQACSVSMENLLSSTNENLLSSANENLLSSANENEETPSPTTWE